MKDLKISKELLSEVLKFTKYNFIKEGFIEIEDSILKYGVKHNIYEKINIYELAHKCKEWAIKNDFFIFSGYNGNYNCFVNHSGNRFFGDTEPEAIFKATQYIYNNLSN